MPDIYKNLENGLPVNALPSVYRTTWGEQVLAGTNGVSTIDALFASFCRHYRNAGRWVWTGAARTPAAGAMLDGDANARTGQCLALARAFRLLATFRRPLGLGFAEAAVGNPGDDAGGQYKGQFGNGFVSVHSALTSPGTVLGLPANVFTAPLPNSPFTRVTAGTARTGLYLWANHKTVPYLGRYYDPSYGRVWDSKPQMAQYHLHAGQPLQRVELTATGQQKTTSYLPATAPNGGTVYFRALLDDEVMATNTNGYQGPFAVLPGREWLGQNVAMLRQSMASQLSRLQSKAFHK
jgi:hypothetical protein